MIIKVLVILGALAAPFCAAAAEPAQEGMTVVRDPQTGRLRAPTPAELRALRSSIVRDPALLSQPVKSTLRPDGTRSIALGERGMVYSVMTRGADGKLAGYCVKGEQAAAKAIENQQEAQHEHP